MSDSPMMQVAEAAIEFVKVRQCLREAKRLRNGFHCTEEDEGDPLMGGSRPACWRDFNPPHDSVSDLCESCQKRVKAHDEAVRLGVAAAKSLRSLKYAVKKATA